jgi:peptidoglycan/LPS O-acetylase OafA/YrhL
MNNALLARIGVISYSVYLLHEYIGVVLINKLGLFVHSAVIIKLMPLLVIALLVIFADIIYRVYEKPVTGFFRKMLVK